MEMASVPNGSKYEVVVSESALGEMEAKKSSLKDEATQFCMMNVEAAIGSARMWTVVNVSVPVLATSIPNVVIGYHQQVQMPPQSGIFQVRGALQTWARNWRTSGYPARPECLLKAFRGTRTHPTGSFGYLGYPAVILPKPVN
ncbi:hypothetical protein F442_07157 [Phytophthora nicotianae P10297]|uniref:Uncharacterized protein n=1 Tax=Phytophthora nicotianae P10297 TaxID=1317064 RepID=W2ZGV4_PHYNI|nr:hypothetical protein F442_07157 [Phytophthora nicotianae P10297]